MAMGGHPIFTYPTRQEDLENAQRTLRSIRFATGRTTFNTELADAILLYNGACRVPYRRGADIFWSVPVDCEDDSLPLANHFRGTKDLIANKAKLADMIQQHPRYAEISFLIPRTFIIPRDRQFLLRSLGRGRIWISKPSGGSGGHGISIFTRAEGIPGSGIVSEYIRKPLLIDGFKFDLRIYVLVTSFAPLRAFLYREGLARLATDEYTERDFHGMAHITNATLNKMSSKWTDDRKIRMTAALRAIADRDGVSFEDLFEKIRILVMLSLAVIQPTVAKRASGSQRRFELYGFDVLFDSSFNAHLLEINCNPSIETGDGVDFEVKAPLVARTLSIVGVGVKPSIVTEDEANRASGDGFVRIFPSGDDFVNSFLRDPWGA